MTGRWMMALIQMTFAVMPAAVYWLGGWEVAHGTPPSAIVGTLVAFTTLQTRLFAPIGSLLSISVDVQSSLALFDRIFEYLDLPVDIVEGTRVIEGVRGDVRIEHAWFRYANADTWALEDVDVEIPAGTTTAIVGETGAGKTSLGYLVSRLYDVTKGRVTIGRVHATARVRPACPGRPGRCASGLVRSAPPGISDAPRSDPGESALARLLCPHTADGPGRRGPMNPG